MHLVFNQAVSEAIDAARDLIRPNRIERLHDAGQIRQRIEFAHHAHFIVELIR
ncbi:hypothetical protein [Trueperella pecoris]|uniref:hypothetical protein n=1 Tax=Trueperella pecoris TaxID=2733571 RepID=UPI00186B5FB7|nr:hypothetical protein [Trueperella pecoris]QOQ38534.1 hypothetical protein HLG82_03080 [Trueperella pecoris]